MKKAEVMQNPFFEIAHKGDEDIILDKKSIEKIKSLTKEVLKNNAILFIVGDPGSGKSLVEKEIESDIPKGYVLKKYDFTKDLLAELRAIPVMQSMKKKTIVFIDKFEMSEVIDDKQLKNILEIIKTTSKSGVGYVVSGVPENLERIQEISPETNKQLKVYRTPALSFEQAKKIVVSRLNSVRSKNSDSIAPFTEQQLKKIWLKSNGNPKMILLLCGTLYDALNSW